MTARWTDADRARALESLRHYFPTPETIINVNVVAANDTGSRRVQVYAVSADGRVNDVSRLVAILTGTRHCDPWRNPSGLSVRGIGLDVAHDIADRVHLAVWPDHPDAFAFNRV